LPTFVQNTVLGLTCDYEIPKLFTVHLNFYLKVSLLQHVLTTGSGSD